MTSLTAWTQNLAPNPSFEFYSSCPPTPNYGNQTLQCDPWRCATAGTADYFNICSTPDEVGIPMNFLGYQDPVSGGGYCGIFTRTSSSQYREYIQAELLSPLESGKIYHVSFYASMAWGSCSIQWIGAYFSDGAPPWQGDQVLDYEPQVESSGNYLTDSIGWMLIEGCFTAQGGETHITIGNFRNNGETPPDPNCQFPGFSAYYYIEDVTVEEILPGGIPLDLGGPLDVCDDYEIEPGITGVTYLWDDGSTGSTLNVNSSGTYSLTVTGGCESGIDSIEINFINQLPVNIPESDIQLCPGGTYVLSLNSDAGSYTWQDGSTSSEYTISEPGVYQVSMYDGCDLTTDEVFVFLLEPPTVSLGPDITLCSGEEVDIYLDPDMGEFLWHNNTTSNSFIISGPGDYAVTVTNACGTSSDEIEVFEGIPLAFSLGPDTLLCPGEQLVLIVESDGLSYIWQDFSQADTFLVEGPGAYFVTASNECNTYSDTIEVDYSPESPTLILPETLVLCQSAVTVIDPMVADVSFLWNDGTQQSTLSVSTPGIYSLTISNSCGSTSDSTVVLDGGPIPFISLGPDFQLCPNDTFLLLPAFYDVDSWFWHDGSADTTFLISDAGVVSVEVANACGVAGDTLNVSLLPAVPDLDLGADTIICSGDSFTLSILDSDVMIQWPDGSGDTTFLVTGPGLVHASISNTCGTAHDTIQITASPDIPDLNLGPDQSLCPGEIIEVSPGIANVQYLWQDGSAGSTYQSIQAETIILTISNACGSSSDTLQITESTQGPQLDLGEDIQVCLGEVVTIPSGISGVSYLWQDGSTDPIYITAQSGVVVLEVTNNCGSATDSILVDISGTAPTIDLPADITLCEGVSLLLEADVDAETTIEWQDGSTVPTYLVTSAGAYSFFASNRCGNDADTLLVTYIEAPDSFTLGSDTTLCPGETLTLQAPITSNAILWQDGSDQPIFIADQALTYSLQITNECGMKSAHIVVDYNTDIPQLDIEPSIVVCPGDVVSLDATQPFPATYSWSTGATGPILQVVTPGVYSIDVTTPCSMISMETEVYLNIDCLEQEEHTGIYIPNVFSPNGDGINDLFGVSFGSDMNVTAMTGSIFDRWGNLVYQSDQVPFEWDGLYAEELVMPGVYVYVIECTYQMDGVETFVRRYNGDITLIR